MMKYYKLSQKVVFSIHKFILGGWGAQVTMYSTVTNITVTTEV
jgi:hypothetical protein